MRASGLNFSATQCQRGAPEVVWRGSHTSNVKANTYSPRVFPFHEVREAVREVRVVERAAPPNFYQLQLGEGEPSKIFTKYLEQFKFY